MGRETIDSQHMIDIRKFRSRWCLKSSSSYWTIQRSRNWTKTGVVAFTTCIWEDTSSLVIDFTATNNRTKEEKKYEIHINLAKKECNLKNIVTGIQTTISFSELPNFKF